MSAHDAEVQASSSIHILDYPFSLGRLTFIPVTKHVICQTKSAFFPYLYSSLFSVLASQPLCSLCHTVKILETLVSLTLQPWHIVVQSHLLRLAGHLMQKQYGALAESEDGCRCSGHQLYVKGQCDSQEMSGGVVV